MAYDYPEYQAGYAPAPWPKRYRRDRDKSPRQRGFIMLAPNVADVATGAVPLCLEVPSGQLIVTGHGNRVRDAVHGACEILAIPRCDWVDFLASLEFDHEDDPDRTNRLQRFNRFMFAPASTDRVSRALAPGESTYLRLLDSAPNLAAQGKSIAFAMGGLVRNRAKAHRSLRVRCFGPDVMLIKGGEHGGSRFDVVLSGPSDEANCLYGERFEPCVGPIEPYHDLLFTLQRSGIITALELVTALPDLSARMRTAREGTLQIFVGPADFGAWTNDLLGWFAYGADGGWPIEVRKPGHIRLLAPSKKKGGTL